jgi:Stage II sporulation protein E (SpoIIE)
MPVVFPIRTRSGPTTMTTPPDGNTSEPLRLPGLSGPAWTGRPPVRGPRRFSLRRRAIGFAGILLVVALVFATDYATGKQISFSLVYLVPIALAAWFMGVWPATLVALVASVGWAIDHSLDAAIYARRPIFYWNVGAETGIFLLVSASVALIRAELDKTRALAGELAFAYERLDRELRIVGEVQRSMLPARLPRVPGARVLAHYATSERSGGDYYDFFELPGGRTGILIADAAGHGSPAAVLMAMMRILLHSASRDLLPAERVLAQLNADLVDNLPWGQFITACYAIYDPATRGLQYALAGHNPPFILRRRTGEVGEFVNRSGLPLGVRAAVRYQGESIALEEGDTVLFYTDGLTEAQDTTGRLLGAEAVVDMLRAQSGAPAETVLERVLDGLAGHLGAAPLSDDTTLIVLQAVGKAAEAAPEVVHAGMLEEN